jgi:hypothetical protein
VRPIDLVVDAPRLDRLLCVGQAHEPILVQALVAEFALEAFDAGKYHVYAHEYIANRPFSTSRSAATFFVGETRLVKGRSNLYPRRVGSDRSRVDSTPRVVVDARHALAR